MKRLTEGAHQASDSYEDGVLLAIFILEDNFSLWYSVLNMFTAF